MARITINTLSSINSLYNNTGRLNGKHVLKEETENLESVHV